MVSTILLSTPRYVFLEHAVHRQVKLRGISPLGNPSRVHWPGPVTTLYQILTVPNSVYKQWRDFVERTRTKSAPRTRGGREPGRSRASRASGESDALNTDSGIQMSRRSAARQCGRRTDGTGFKEAGYGRGRATIAEVAGRMAGNAESSFIERVPPIEIVVP